MASWLPRGHGSGLQGVPELGTEIELGNSGAGGRLSGLPADPEPGPAGPAGEDAPKLPYLTEGFAPVELAASGEMATKPVSLAGHFVDPQGSSLPIALCPRRLVS